MAKVAIGAAIVCGIGFTATAQTAEPTFKGDPAVYKVIFEDANYRVIEATRKAGVHDKAHGHPVASVVYNVTDCTTKQYAADGKVAESTSKAGSVTAVPVIASHSAENIGQTDCKQIFVEKK
jgi:oxalate decarboxylase/phosphoglucose isomerase-like protein (cupin superfamily)